MKIIDEKGRLFGLINLLDLAVLVALLAALFVGFSAWLALREQPVEVIQYSPMDITAGSEQEVMIKLKNEHYLLNARLFLSPTSYTGSTFSYTASIPINVRDSAIVTLPPDLRPGTYQARLEVTTMNVFQRKTVSNLLIAENFVLKEAEFQDNVKATPVFNSKCNWLLAFDAVLIDEEQTPFILGQDSTLVDESGVAYRITGVMDSIAGNTRQNLASDVREKASRLIGFEVVTSYDSLFNLFSSAGNSLTLSSGNRRWTVVPLDNATAELDFLFYLNEQDQAGLLTSQMALSGQGGGKAMVVHSFGDINNPWATKAAALPEDNPPSTFDVARISLECDFRENGLYFGRSRLEPNRLLNFQADGVSITGGILSTRQPMLTMDVRVMLEALPVQLEKLLSPGLIVTSNSGNLRFGILKRIVAVDAVSTPEQFLASQQSGFGQNFKRVILDMEINCLLSDGKVLCSGQPLDFGLNFNFALLGQPLSGIIRYESSLPERSVASRENIQVEFSSVPPDVVAWIRAGEQEYAPNKPSSWKIVRIVSNQPAALSSPIPDPRQGLITEHPINRDIRCLVELEAFKAGNDIYYAGGMLKIGSPIMFSARRWARQANVVAF